MEMLAEGRMAHASGTVHRAGGMHLLQDFSARPQDREKWNELWSSGAVVVGVLCLTSSIAALILRFVGAH